MFNYLFLIHGNVSLSMISTKTTSCQSKNGNHSHYKHELSQPQTIIITNPNFWKPHFFRAYPIFLPTTITHHNYFHTNTMTSYHHSFSKLLVFLRRVIANPYNGCLDILNTIYYRFAVPLCGKGFWPPHT